VGRVAFMGTRRNIEFWIRIPQERLSIEKFKHKGEDNIKMSLRKLRV
jgi:hypothetical protein